MIKTKRKNFGLIKVLAILSIIVFPLPERQQTALANTAASQAIVNVPELNVREAADISSKVIGLVHQGDTFEILQTKNNWDQIKLSSKQTGWVYNAYITPAENIEASVEAIVLNVRKQPSLSSRVTDTLKMGAKITILQEQGGWAKVVTPSGVQGWVYEYYISKSSANQQADKKGEPQATASDTKTAEKSGIQGNKQTSKEPLKGKTIVLDPGHGGMDNGTTSIIGTPEKTLTLETAKVVEQKLAGAGANVIMTRTDDTLLSLQQCVEPSNLYHADAFISFHYNWSNDPAASGVTDFYYYKSKDNLLATYILNEVAKTTKLPNDGTRFDDLYVLRNNLRPSTLLELGFLSNKQDDPIVETPAFRENVAEGVYQGLLNYFSAEK